MPTGIYKHKPLSKEHKRKISEAMKGKRPQDYKNWCPSCGMKGKVGYWKGKKRPLAGQWMKQFKGKGLQSWMNISGLKKGQGWNKGGTSWSKGKKLSKEHVEKVRQSLIKRSDRIGRKKYIRPKHNTHWKYREWRKLVYERDNYKCWICEATNLNAHHLKSWAKYPKLRYKVNNGLTLCEFCHKIYA